MVSEIWEIKNDVLKISKTERFLLKLENEIRFKLNLSFNFLLTYEEKLIKKDFLNNANKVLKELNVQKRKKILSRLNVPVTVNIHSIGTYYEDTKDLLVPWILEKIYHYKPMYKTEIKDFWENFYFNTGKAIEWTGFNDPPLNNSRYLRPLLVTKVFDQKVILKNDLMKKTDKLVDEIIRKNLEEEVFQKINMDYDKILNKHKKFYI